MGWVECLSSVNVSRLCTFRLFTSRLFTSRISAQLHIKSFVALITQSMHGFKETSPVSKLVEYGERKCRDRWNVMTKERALAEVKEH